MFTTKDERVSEGRSHSSEGDNFCSGYHYRTVVGIKGGNGPLNGRPQKKRPLVIGYIRILFRATSINGKDYPASDALLRSSTENKIVPPRLD